MQKNKSQTSDLFLEQIPPQLPQFSADSFSNSPMSPLAVRMRPKHLKEVAGQDHILGEGKILSRMVRADRLSSIILFGPPGCGKTSLARVISNETRSHFVCLNAVESGAAEIRRILEDARKLRKAQNKKTVLFVDEIHRFNKAQQDLLMPDVEESTILLIGATTHNPSFAVNGPLLSRATLFELRRIGDEAMKELILRAISDVDRGLGKYQISISDDALAHIINSASGDARRALTALEIGVLSSLTDSGNRVHYDVKVAEESCQKKWVLYDRDGDAHYDTASAFIKSMRGSDPDAALYWLAVMLEAGEDPRFIVRRILIFAAEDIGNADPQALILASSSMQAVEFVGLPECRIILSQLVIYMSMAPKSNSSIKAIDLALNDVRAKKTSEVPIHLKDSHYSGAEKLGRGKGYQYDHNFPGHFSGQSFHEAPIKYYFPSDQGQEEQMSRRLAEYRKVRRPQKP